MNRFLISMMVMILVFSFGIGIASAHVTVQPEETVQGKYETFTVQVPSELEESPTVKVEIEIQSSVFISRFEPKSGWRYEVKRDDSDKITSVTWIAENNGLSPTEFGLFYMQGRVADDATEIVWKAVQTYQDGTIVEWVGAEDSQTPASVSKVLPNSSTGSGSHQHGEEHSVTTEEELAEHTEKNADSETTSNPTFFISIAALIVALLSIGIALFKRK